MKKNYPFLLFVLGIFVLIGLFSILLSQKGISISSRVLTPREIAQHYPPPPIPTPTIKPTPTPSPTPRPLTFAEMNALYGPCVFLPTLMYHHIQDLEKAKENGQFNLTVGTDYFRRHMQYFKDHGYRTATMNDLVNFFDSGVPIGAKSVLLTIDDGYGDFATDAVPILREFGFKATLFTPTGLINNPGYLSWDTINSLAPGGDILFANHTWSHHNLQSSADVVEREITTADTQLTEKGLGNPKVFAYPYGLSSAIAQSVLSKLGYKLAFTTVPGSTLCKKLRLDLPRVRVGNADLSAYGF